ncbi:MAG: hypothetical protein ACOVNU_04155 [Candidatus Kapaibacteriota bacterium]
MAQTSVEWYIEQLNIYGDKAFNKEITLGEFHIKKQELLEQAKEMYKEEHKTTFDAGMNFSADYFDPTCTNTEAENYYNETFKKQ